MAVFIKLTRLDGAPVWLRAGNVTRVSRPIDRADSNATVTCDGVHEVKEYAEDVVKMIERASVEPSAMIKP
jgi:hypothetical protein